MLLNCGVGEDSWESLGLQGDQPVHPKGDQSWIFIGRTDAEAEAPILWPPDGKNWLIGKGPDAGKDWRWKEKGTTEDEMVGWHHWFDGHKFEQAPGVGDGQGGLVCCSPWGHKESDTIERLNWRAKETSLLVLVAERNSSPARAVTTALWAEVSAEEYSYFERLFRDAQSTFITLLGPQKWEALWWVVLLGWV